MAVQYRQICRVENIPDANNYRANSEKCNLAMKINQKRRPWAAASWPALAIWLPSGENTTEDTPPGWPASTAASPTGASGRKAFCPDAEGPSPARYPAT